MQSGRNAWSPIQSDPSKWVIWSGQVLPRDQPFIHVILYKGFCVTDDDYESRTIRLSNCYQVVSL